MSIAPGTMYDIVDGPSELGVLDCFASTHKKNVSSTHTWELRLRHDRIQTRATRHRQFRLQSLKYESGGEFAQYIIEGSFMVGSQAFNFEGYYNTRTRNGWINVKHYD